MLVIIKRDVIFAIRKNTNFCFCGVISGVKCLYDYNLNGFKTLTINL